MEDFPKCNPHQASLSRLGSNNDKIRYSAYRRISSSFIKRKDVRNMIFERYNNKCVICGGTEHLQIDHIVSVYLGYKNRMNIDELNSIENLQTLCRSCNSSKKPTS